MKKHYPYTLSYYAQIRAIRGGHNIPGSRWRFRHSLRSRQNDGCRPYGGKRGIWAAGSAVGLRGAVRAAHIPFPCRNGAYVIPPHPNMSVATADRNRVAESPTKPPTHSYSLFIIHHSSFFIVFHLLRQRTRPRNRPILLWLTVLQ